MNINFIWLLKKEKNERLFWYAFQMHPRMVEILSGRVGEKGKLEKIRTDIHNKVEPILNLQKEELLENGYLDVSHQVADVLNLIILKKGDHSFNEENLPEEIDDLIEDCKNEINEFLFERGLTGYDSFIDFKNGNLIMQFFTFDLEMSNKIIAESFHAQLEELKIKIIKWQNQSSP